MENIQKNLKSILAKINLVHKSSLFSKHKIPRLVAVSKKQEDYKVDKALACGQKIFGENRVQEAKSKFEEIKRKNPPIIVLVVGISFIPNNGNQTQKIPPITSVSDSNVNSAAGIALDPIEYNIKPKQTKVP